MLGLELRAQSALAMISRKEGIMRDQELPFRLISDWRS